METFGEFEDFEEFEEGVAQKALPETYKTALIQGLCQKNASFCADTALKALGQSQTFFYELGGLFSALYGKISAAELFALLKIVEINQQDKKRLEIIFEIYENFSEKIKNSDYCLTKEKDRAEIFASENLNLQIKKEIEKFEKRAYIEFEDAQSETIFIAREIERLGKNGALWSNFGIYVQNGKQRRTFVEIFDALKVPTNYDELSENFIQFRIKFEQFLNLCTAQGEEEALISENLHADADDLAQVRKFYRAGEICKIISLIAKNEKIDEAQINKRVGAFLNFYKGTVGEKPDNSYILSIVDNILYNSKNGAKNSVTIFSGLQNRLANKDFKYLWIPSLIENAFVKREYIHFISQKTNAGLSAAIQKIIPDFKGLIPGKDVTIDTGKFQDVLAQGISSLTLSSFNYADTKQVQPSVLFDLFKNNDAANFKTYKKDCGTTIEAKIHAASEQAGSQGASVLGADRLYLSPSAISNFQSCPKKYYFQNILKLKEKNDFLASYGSIAHAILEVFNQNYLKKYKQSLVWEKSEMLKLCEMLFEAKKSPENALECGFSETDVNLIQATDEMTLAQMKDNFYDAAQELEGAGFFEIPPEEVVCEKSFEFELPGIEGVVFNGRIDCILGHNGKYSVLDYKTGKDRKRLEYFVSENGVNFLGERGESKGKFSEKLVEEYNYQIPIYFLGTELAADLTQFRDKIKDFSLLYVRPQSLDGGYKKDSVSVEALKNVREKVIENLKKYVVEPIKNVCEFEPKPSLYKCLNCSYSFLCDCADFDFEGTADD